MPVSIAVRILSVCAVHTFCYGTKQHTAKWRYRAQYVKNTDLTLAKRELRDCSRAEEERNGGPLAAEAKEVPRVKRVGILEVETSIAEFVPKF